MKGKPSSLQGKVSWKKGKNLEEIYRGNLEKIEETRKKNSISGQKMWKNPKIREAIISKTSRGKKNYWYGKKRNGELNPRYGSRLTKETKEKIRKKAIGRKATKETKERLSKIVIERYKDPVERMKSSQPGEKNGNWKDGISKEPYGFDFTEELKEQIRKRDNYICQECKYSEKQLGYKLSVHHIDYDKKNNREDNLLSLCKSCHSQTNYKREDWTNYFKEKLK